MERMILSKNEIVDNPNLADSAKHYEALRSKNDGGVKTGLYSTDLEQALVNPRTVSVEDCLEDGRIVKLPVLVPLDDTEWYNLELFRSAHGVSREYFLYTNPPALSIQAKKDIERSLRTAIDDGAVIVMELNSDQNEENIAESVGHEPEYVIENIDKEELRRHSDVYVGLVNFDDAEDIKQTQSLLDTYDQQIAEGNIKHDPINGVSIERELSDYESDQIWEIYREEFDKLTETHPMKAGFSRQDLHDFIKDPEIAKVVNRKNGVITTLCLVMENFEKCPWFNEDYYKANYPRYFETGNILIFPGIVTDGSLRGKSFSVELIATISRLAQTRKTNSLITFECTEVSTGYIPRIVTRAINGTDTAVVSGLEEPVSSLDYKILKKSA